MTKTVPVLAACAMLCSGCSLSLRTETLPDPRIPHRLAEPAVLSIWTRRPDGVLTKETVRADAGWWVAGPQVVDP